jgi:hypothetical protein
MERFGMSKNWTKVAAKMLKDLPDDYKQGESGWDDLAKRTMQA